MKHEQGVLCLIIGARTEVGRKQIGKTVTLVKHLSENERGEHMGSLFRCHSGYQDYWIVVGDVTSMRGAKGVSAFAQKHLLPIKNPKQHSDLGMNEVTLTVAGHKVEGFAPDVEIKA